MAAAILPPLLALLAVLGMAAAHGGLANYTVDGTWYRGFDPSEQSTEQIGQPWMVQRVWSTIDPVFSVSSPFLACNTPGTPSPGMSSIPIRVGDILTAIYWYWLHPVGPMSVWLAPCPTGSCADVDVNQIGWFKIWEAGLLEGNLVEGTWYQKQFQKWDGEPDEWPVVIPRILKPGMYLVRHEILSIHVEEKPQFYPECAHLNITKEDDNGVLPPDGFWKRFPGAYEEDDPSIKINIYAEKYQNTTNYTIPGGPIWDQ
ncbi:glycoside hydrolase family 61 protein [Echria macrotheca]|uniref:lytic cellulose monooxygenase (C4-dehydrogenating) n=1 Tax=Echria macrotheca TaxID=438768 RepID=A0AAJ0B9L0_9PEZI|nr:glycoside hydrolase family 61 protein [Echria macrotheca]